MSCCSGAAVNETLTATITNLANCPCADGAEIELKIEPIVPTWSGRGPFGSCGREIGLTLICDGNECEHFKLDYEFSDACIGAGQIPAPESCSCDPLNLEFRLGPTGGCCNHPTPDDQFAITITE
ncbi:MAG: hypothetical protein DWQ34_13905 [Planctomycetota bacterium]|nr:MAG: hypothetical protein DWQ34_13905 [Planctomycetota bacterium]REK21698.1 MAG: hypothetical protein DWQ41_20730 [Planctomycetota bacterium]REK32741.1 MAG: hypothetical protein DWQ45_16720 [Planctomycetota bacterium]